MFETMSSLDTTVRDAAGAHAGALDHIAELDADNAWERDGATSMSAWLAGRYGLTRATATEWVRVARALRSLPAIRRAYREGRLSWDQLRPLTRFAERGTDERWSAEAPSRSAAWLWQEMRRMEEIRERDVDSTQRGRYLSLDWNEERSELYLQGRLGAEQGAAFERAVLERSEEVVVADDPHDRHGARLADALVELTTETSGNGGHPTLVVHADAGVLTNEEAEHRPCLAETEDGTRLPSESVRRLACDARIEWILERDGRAVGIGRQGRAVPGSVARALRHRDRWCRFPGCERTRWVKAHHVRHWARGGGTDLDNLVLLCHAHHRLVHEGGWSIRGRPSDELRFHDPAGRNPFPRAAATAVAA
jgi:hypothetical protein